MAYCTQADIEARFGESNVAKWSQADQDSTATDTDRVTAAIAYADAEIDSMMRGGRYTLPLSGTDTSYIVKSWSVRLAACWLYESRGIIDVDRESNPMAVHRKDVVTEIRSVRMGAMRLSLTEIASSTSAPAVV